MKSLVTFAIVFAAACGGKLPETRYYQLAPPASTKHGGDLTLVMEPLSTSQAYDDERIVYRSTPYRLDYYQYHRWSASPGTMVGDYLEQAFEHSGRFRAVTRDATSESGVILGGRVVAIEEVDNSKTSWVGRIVIELTLTDVHTGKALWSQQFEETEPLPRQSPEGLARALSAAMNRIALAAAPEIEAAARPALLNAVR